MKPSKIASIVLAFASRDEARASVLQTAYIKGARLVRQVLIGIGLDPVCMTKVSRLQSEMLMPMSHRMPLYRAKNEKYDVLPQKLAAYIRESEDLKMLDVGANIGDTILTTMPTGSDSYLAIEPHSTFFPYLTANTSRLHNVTRLQVACGADEGVLKFGATSNGTAASQAGATDGDSICVMTLDTIWERIWNREKVNFLKVDTDGFDVEVLAGASALLLAQRPWVLYECDLKLTEGGLNSHLLCLEFFRRAGYRRLAMFDNFGLFVAQLELTDVDGFSKLCETQSPGGPVYYHDVLIMPPQFVGRDLERLV